MRISSLSFEFISLFYNNVKMSPVLLNLSVLLSLGVTVVLSAAVLEDMPQVVFLSKEDGFLPCTAKHKPGVQYRAVRWYKVGEDPSDVSGLLTRSFPSGLVRLYSGVERNVSFVDESNDIYLPNVTCSDSGVYRCHLAAPVGEQNREGQILLTVPDCPVGPTEYKPSDTYLVIFATAVLMLALVIFLLSYYCLKNTIKEKKKTPKKETFLNASLKPLDKKDLMLIYTLGPKTSTMKHICV
ncbi:CD83 antigen [Acanthochromis polyacanthus]|uniref:CD83 antigen n=1 Tax=Acanthochromis polyacanthus TaxID=80966 RepID=UPI00223480F3|nr:CD83 antigen [Acanthochromis polyacanthus]